MKGHAGKLLKVYTCLMKLYPSRYQNEFGEERQGVFALALEEGINRGNKVLLRLLLCELHDLPVSAIRANLRELEVMMKTIETKLGEERLSWIGLLLGIWHFFFAGPLMAILPYLPRSTAQLFNINSPLWLATVYLSIIIGIYLGWRKNFPRWVYPYMVIPFVVIVFLLSSRLGRLIPRGFNPWIASALLLIFILGSGAAVLFLLSRIPFTRKIFNDVRTDWTRLSFGMVVFLAFTSGFYGGDHLPPFTPAVWLPSVIVVLGAVAYLLSRTRILRFIMLTATIGIVFLEKMIIANDETWALLPNLILLSLIFSPMLVGLFPHPRLPQANE